MTSFKHINIDWSTPSSSFIQVDAYTKTPVADLYNIKHNHTSLNVLSTQDILYYDIDIYLKFYKRSLPKEEPLPPQEDFPSPINATHNENAFSSLNAPTTIPRDHNTPKNDLPDTYPSTDVVTPSKKNITSPFPSSTHNNIYRDITVASSKEKTTDLPISPANTKITHANLLHARWSSKYTKKVQSNRTGRSYNVSYSARGLNELKVSSYKHIYSKRLTNFQTSLSGHSNVAKKQNERFERSERRRFNQDRLSTSKDLNPSDKARIGRRTRFLFSGIREIKIPIKHLQYKKARKIFWQKDYKFLLPYDGLMPTVEPYNPRPKGFIPMKYRDIIPPDPIYTKNGSFIVPGSREWYTHMYKLEKIVRLTPIWEKEEKERQQLILDHGSSAKHHDLRQDMKMRLTELNDLYHEGLIIYRNDLIENGKSTHPNYYGYVDNLYRTTEDNYKNFMVRYNNKRNCYRDDFKKRLNTKKGRMNDETKRIEHRPNKRDCPSSFSTIDTSSPPLPKKPRCGERPLSILTKSSY
ncbi:unnamed protein product [Rhizophagus irregularis]|nr:unnamed protein product [Rhizophagus irregularis]